MDRIPFVDSLNLKIQKERLDCMVNTHKLYRSTHNVKTHPCTKHIRNFCQYSVN